jgi:hypothetical protein
MEVLGEGGPKLPHPPLTVRTVLTTTIRIQQDLNQLIIQLSLSLNHSLHLRDVKDGSVQCEVLKEGGTQLPHPPTVCLYHLLNNYINLKINLSINKSHLSLNMCPRDARVEVPYVACWEEEDPNCHTLPLVTCTTFWETSCWRQPRQVAKPYQNIKYQCCGSMTFWCGSG